MRAEELRIRRGLRLTSRCWFLAEMSVSGGMVTAGSRVRASETPEIKFLASTLSYRKYSFAALDGGPSTWCAEGAPEQGTLPLQGTW